jgi:NADH-quinone oxidoreductase subunit L
MMVLISSIGMVLHLYSQRYLQQDPGLSRFMTLLTLCLSTLLFMVSSSDLVTLFMTWQLLSWFLCLLAHNFAHVPTVKSSFRVFMTLRAGDIAFLCGIALAYHLYGTVELSQLFRVAAADQTQLSLFGSAITITGPTAITMLLLIGGMSKSAQFPLHMWLPDSMYAPTPITALLHAGIINAAGFLLNRLAPLYALSPVTLHVVLAVGLCTVVFGKCMMLTKSDIKKILGYSTIGQMGYMMVECGLGAFSLAVFHLIAHGLFKATVLLNCGDVIHKARLYPAHPPAPATLPPASPVFPRAESHSRVSWLVGILVSLVAPLFIIIGAHYLLGIAFLNPQGMFIFVLFSWITVAHATLTLFRLNSKPPLIAAMMTLVVLFSTAYFFTAEHFTHFLYPDNATVSSYFQAAALPEVAFWALSAALIVTIITSWFLLLYHFKTGSTIRKGDIWAWLYLFFLNRLYLDASTHKFFGLLKKLGHNFDRSSVTLPIVVLLALGFAAQQVSGGMTNLAGDAGILLLSALCLPLFPLHGLYKAALTRAPRTLALILALVLPVTGVLLMPRIPEEFLPAVAVLAGFGALWGSLKALMAVRVPHLLAGAGLALYSILWWHVAQTGKIMPGGLSYVWSVTLVIGGLMLAWDRISARYGDLDLNHIGGLFKPMPRLALCVGLLVMAGLGLPPFGLFFGYAAILFSHTSGFSFGLIAIIAAWFAASWYLFSLMQKLLFGQHRGDLLYEDLRSGEVAAFVVILALLVIPVSMPQNLLETKGTDVPAAIEEIS